MVMLVTFKVFKQHQVGSKCGAEGITSEVELYWIAIGGLNVSNYVIFWLVPLSCASPEWFQNAESMMNHHLAGLLGLGCLSWSGHQIHY
jgi:photosystem I P700 chlorophyll a apoprotein A1